MLILSSWRKTTNGSIDCLNEWNRRTEQRVILSFLFLSLEYRSFITCIKKRKYSRHLAVHLQTRATSDDDSLSLIDCSSYHFSQINILISNIYIFIWLSQHLKIDFAFLIIPLAKTELFLSLKKWNPMTTVCHRRLGQFLSNIQKATSQLRPQQKKWFDTV